MMKRRKTAEEVDQKYHDRRVVLVSEVGEELGEAGLVPAHRGRGLKHLAFSLVLYRKVEGGVQLLLQQRSKDKPVFPELWGNTCCYNMAPGEEFIPRAVSRVYEEMGVEIPASKLQELYRFSYYATDQDGWCENELDTVIVGEWDGQVKLNPEEAMDYKWINWGEMKQEMEREPGNYVPWWTMIVSDGRLERYLFGE